MQLRGDAANDNGHGSWFTAVFLFSLSSQSFCPQPFHIFALCDLLLLVFGQRAVRWAEYVVGVVFAFAHDMNFRGHARIRCWP